MELGATLCHPGEPDCDDCPWRGLCDAAREGDAALLPVHEKKRPPKRVDVAVCLLTWKRRVLVTRRDERMLGGLYVFCLLEDETRPERAEALLREAGLPCRFTEDLGAGASCLHPSGMGDAAMAFFSGGRALAAGVGSLRRPHGFGGGASRPAPAHRHACGGAGGAGAAPAPGKSGLQRLTRGYPHPAGAETPLQRPRLPDSAAASAA